jgi:hypothetical protein
VEGDDLEGWLVTMALGPCFTLRLLEDEEATIDVRVEQSQLDAPLVLIAI